MKIINPLYDTAFKLLMEDLDIAKGVIRSITGLDIVQLDFSATEHIIKKDSEDREKSDKVVEERRYSSIILFRLDFKAKVREKDGGYHNVLIEIQKAKLSQDITRFRKYLGKQYSTQDEVPLDNGGVKRMNIPIITIYLLGFELEKVHPLAIHVMRNYFNASTSEQLDVPRNKFIEALTHDAFIIQIPKVAELKGFNNDLERVMSVFNQSLIVTKEGHILDYDEAIKDPLIEKMVRTLHKGVADEEIEHQMEFEDQLECEVLSAILEREDKIKELDNKLHKAEDERRQAEDEKRQAEEREKNANAQNEKILKSVAKLQGITIEEARKMLS